MRRRRFLTSSCQLALSASLLGSCKGTGSAPAVISAGDRLRLSYYFYDLQLEHVFTVASYSRTFTPDVQVEIRYGDLVGYGEASLPQYLGQTQQTVGAFLDKVRLEQFTDPLQIEDILSYVDSLSDGDSSAKAAVDIALHDLVGKILSRPWYQLWGLNPQKTPNTTFTIGIDTPEVVRQKTRETADRFRILKVKLGGGNDREMIESIRQVSDLPLAVDANQGWKSVQEATDMIHYLKEKGVVLVEQPMAKDRLDDIARITEVSPLPVFADESVQGVGDILPLKGAFTGINIKLMKCGGMRQALKMVHTARALGMKVMMGCMTETSCAVSAMASLSPLADFADLDGNLLITNDLFDGMKVVDGKITLRDFPGIGIQKKEG